MKNCSLDGCLHGGQGNLLLSQRDCKQYDTSVIFEVILGFDPCMRTAVISEMNSILQVCSIERGIANYGKGFLFISRAPFYLQCVL